MTSQITVVIPCFKDVKRTIEAVQSVRSQTFSNWQIIVLDDGSPVKLQAKLVKGINALGDPRIKLVVSAKNRGPARNRNLGLKLSKSTYVAFLDCDDLWKPTKLQEQIDLLIATGASICCTSYRNRNEETSVETVRVPKTTFHFQDLLLENFVGCSSVLIDREKTGPFYFPLIPMRQDYALWLRLLQKGNLAVGIQKELTIRRIHRDALSRNKFRAIYFTWRMFRDTQGFGRLEAMKIFARYLLHAIKNRS